MHMADTLVSPPVGGVLWVAAGALIAFCSRKVKLATRDDLVPQMGVLGAFIFAAQMINFAIPVTGSSGHLGGGLLLSILLGPYAAFLVMASVLTVQAFFFADGGLLALGCNMINLGFIPAFIAYPLVYRPVIRLAGGSRTLGAVVAAVVGLQLGALGVVLETWASGISELPFRTFVLMMLPVHVAIGIFEGGATAAVVAFVLRVRPDALAPVATARLTPVLIWLTFMALVLGGIGSWFASSRPDGLEWAIEKTSGNAEISGPEMGVHRQLADVQSATAVLPDYGFRDAHEGAGGADPWPAVSAGTSVSGVVGGLMTLVLAAVVGLALKARCGSRLQGAGTGSRGVPQPPGEEA